MVYGYGEKVKDQYIRELRNLIYNAVLQSSGQETVCVYTAHEKTSRYVKFVMNSIMCDNEVVNGDIKVFEKVLASYGDAITYTKAKETIKDERPLLKKGQVNKAEFVIREVYRIVISQRYAQEIYNKTFGKESDAFRNKLLRVHYQTLEQIIRKCNLGREHKTELYYRDHSDFQWFCIGLESIKRCIVESEYSEQDIDITGYSAFGMKNLSNIQQCYGMTLALVDILKQTTWAGKHVDIKVTYNWVQNKYTGSTEWIHVAYDFETKPDINIPVLQEW